MKTRTAATDISEASRVALATVDEVIAAPMAAVWAILSDFAHPWRLAPTIADCVAIGEGPGAVRVITSSRGPRIHERLLECDAAAGRWRYEVLADGDMPLAELTAYECTVTLRPLAGGSTGIAWSSVGGIDGAPEPVRDFLTALYRQATARIRAEIAQPASSAPGSR